MQLYAVLSLIISCLALVWTAPLEKQVGMEKRAKERLVFGNQQNAPRIVKKRDPNENTAVSEVDMKGQVLAMPARDVPKSAKTEDAPEANMEASLNMGSSPNVEAGLNEESKPNVEAKPSIENGLTRPTEEIMSTNNESVESAETDGAESVTEDIDPDVQSMLESKPVSDNAIAPAESPETDEKMNDLLKYLMNYENVLDNNTPYNPLNKNSYYLYRRRRSLLKHLNKQRYNSNKAVKRGKRIKRDLYDDEDMYYYPYEAPILAPETYEDVEPELEESDLLAYLLSLYDDRAEPEEPVFEYETPYERALEEAVIEEEAQPAYYRPVKRQLMSTIPGLRKRYFYPVNREPQTHWGAFVPEQKREYLNAYERVLRLARALDNSDDEGYYPELYEGYKKK